MDQPQPGTVIRLPYPPSANSHWKLRARPDGRGRVIPSAYLSKEGKEYRKTVSDYCRALRIQPSDGRLRVTVQVFFPDARIRDIDNLLKPLLDALTYAGAWDDDKQVRDLRIVDKGKRPPGYVIVQIEPLEELLF